MRCAYCGKELPDDSTFCTRCGKSTGKSSLDGVVETGESAAENTPVKTSDSDAMSEVVGAAEQSAVSGESTVDSPGQPIPVTVGAEQPRHHASTWRGLIVGAIMITIAGAIGRSCAGSLLSPTSDQDTGTQVSQLTWSRYTSADGSFSVLFPGSPKVTTKTVKTSSFDYQLNQYACDVNEGALSYSVIAYVYPWTPQTLSETNAHAMLQAVMDSLANSDKWSRVSSTFGATGGFYTLDFLIMGKNDVSGAYLSGRIFVKYSSSVHMATVLSDTIVPQDLDKFLDSFVPH